MINVSQQTYTRNTRFYLMGIAMILVVGFHLAQHQESVNPISKTLLYVFANGWVGVDMFFLLSTYGLCYSYNNNKLKKYYWNRFVRIIPAYPLALIIGYIEAGTPWRQACVDFIQQLSGVAILNDTLDILWYMEALVLLYIVFPMFYYLCKKIYSWGILPFMVLCVLFHLSLIFIPDYWLQMTIKRIPVMMVGVFTYLYEKDGRKSGLWRMYGCLALIALMPLLYDMYLFVPVILLLLSETEKKYLLRPLTFVGKHSLEIFIGHHFALWIFNYSQWNYYVTLLLALLLIVIFALIVYYIQKSFGEILNCFHLNS